MPGDRHLADRDRFASVGGDACLQHRLIVRDGGHALEPRRRRWREGAVGRLRCADETSAGGERDHEKRERSRAKAKGSSD